MSSQLTIVGGGGDGASRLGRLDGFAQYGWDLHQQVDSIRKLADLPFTWVLPGHGRRHMFESDEERRSSILKCADEFEADPGGEDAPGPVYVTV